MMQQLSRGVMVLSALLLAASSVTAAAPETSDPSARLIPGFDAPGEFPTTVTASNINIRPNSGAELDGFGEDDLSLSFPSAGPIAWTSSRANSGDIALSIGPADPSDSRYFFPAGFVDNYQAMNGNSNPIDPNSADNELTTLAWRVSNQTGALLATTRHNGVDDGYVKFDFTDVGTIRGVSYFNSGFAQGWGFQMANGEFANSGPGSSDLQMGHFGDGDGAHEAVFNVATAYFPYEQGWKGAWVNGAADGESTFAAGSSAVTESEVTWTNGLADVQLTNVDSATDGMLFVAPSNSSSTTRIASAFPNQAGGWTTTIRLEDDDDTTGQTYQNGGDDFQFLYVPYDTPNLIGGYIDGATGTSINSAGDTQFDLTRTATGDYSLSVFEADGVTKKGEDAGMLILSVADTVEGDATIGSRAAMSYEYDNESGDFIVQSRELIDILGSMPFDNFGNEFAGTDSDFYFAWVDFENPLGPVPGDFNANGAVDGGDFLAWQRGESPNGAVPGDLALWQNNYGSGAAPSLDAVPEPATACMMMIATIAAFAGRRA